MRGEDHARKIIFLKFKACAAMTSANYFSENVSVVPAPSVSSFANLKICDCGAVTFETQNQRNAKIRKPVC
jgi:hypothetical protein